MADHELSDCFLQIPLTGSNPSLLKKKRNLPGTPDPEAEVIALSPKTLLATNRFVCEICGKGFQRDQNLQLHRRGHNLPWKLKQRSNKEAKKRVYVCPEKSCVHHHPSRALGDLTGIKKHFCRKHGEKKWKCEKCSKRYAVQSDWKAHSKTCGTREYKCDCGTLFSRRDSFITHRAFCDALAEETARVKAGTTISNLNNNLMGGWRDHEETAGVFMTQHFGSTMKPVTMKMSSNSVQMIGGMMMNNSGGGMYGEDSVWGNQVQMGNYYYNENQGLMVNGGGVGVCSLYSHEFQQVNETQRGNMSATALLQKAAEIGATSSSSSNTVTRSAAPSLSLLQIQQQGFLFNNGSEFCNTNNNPIVVVENNGSEMYTAKRRRSQSEFECGSGNARTGTGTGTGETRDFLGVGAKTTCHSSTSINGWI
ncbi:hypothetical protein IC582_025696 [Cucumis melo]|uniref:Zinc finger protein MAGPIE-like n=2 Tax=Cucumis melo TaxID=3656 RepID=A0A5A7VJW9_CUCMM|nr:zinc finger protein MAGPIE-like [Cucumis melo]KAA0067487.1 zinc finger protein MAGPIE-like [Cucumis melo var. makuwa]